MRLSNKWTPELSYAVGLITTDGSLSKDNRHIDLTSADLQLLKAFKRCLSLNNRISLKTNGYTKKRYYHLQFSDVLFFRRLLQIGLTPNKTHRIGALLIPKSYFRDFLRGHLDGDGSVFTYTDRYMHYKNRRYAYLRLYTVFLSSSETHMRWLRAGIQEHLHITGSLTCQRKTGEKSLPVWKLRYAKSDSLKLLKWIYYNPLLPCLKRKRRIAESALIGLKNR